MTVPCWSQREETETNEERQEVKEQERQKQIEREIAVRRAALSLSELVKFPGEDYTHVCTHTQKVQAHVLCFISSSFFFCSFLPTRSLLSQRLRREVA